MSGLQLRHHTAVLVVGGLVAIDEVYAAVILLTNRWPGLSPAHKEAWDSVGCESLRRLVLDLPEMFTTVQLSVCICGMQVTFAAAVGTAITQHWLCSLVAHFAEVAGSLAYQ